MTERYTITWQQTEIGEVSELTNDMWYFEGLFTSRETEAADQFIKLVSGFDAKGIMKDPYKGTTITLIPAGAPLNKMHFLVISLDSERLFMRILQNETYEMLTSRSKEQKQTNFRFLRQWVSKWLRGR